MNNVSPSRRGFLISTVATGVVLGFIRRARSSSIGDQAEVAPADIFEPTIWYSIDRNGLVTVNIIRAEMGQHVGTALARIVADELEANWADVRIVHVDSDPKWGLMVTGGSWSVWQSFPTMSQAGAAGRLALIEEGARLLGVSPEACIARDSAVSAGPTSIAYRDIVARGDLRRHYTPEQLAAMPIKPAAERRLIGRSRSMCLPRPMARLATDLMRRSTE
jgi:isoquinoline 1-oxidoreductase beta subunit